MSTSPVSQGRYRIATRTGDMIFTAGMTPRDAGLLLLRGRISARQPLGFYRQAVERAAENALQAVAGELADDEEIDRVLGMTVYVAAEDGFEAHSRIADLASDYLHERLGEAGIGSRAAVGVHSLPGGAPVEISLVASARRAPHP